MRVFPGCVQRVVAPDIDAATARIFDRLGIHLVTAPETGCCGALSLHLGAHDEALAHARRNIDALWPAIEKGIEGIVITASGCATVLRDYGRLLAHDAAYAAKAHAFSALVRDPVEVLGNEDLSAFAGLGQDRRIAFQSPCTLQHGARLGGAVEKILTRTGFTLTHVPDGQLCCGSAGSYSLLQAGVSRQLRQRKLTSLMSGTPQCVATANIGCLLHLEAAASVPVVHWVSLLDPG